MSNTLQIMSMSLVFRVSNNELCHRIRQGDCVFNYKWAKLVVGCKLTPRITRLEAPNGKLWICRPPEIFDQDNANYVSVNVQGTWSFEQLFEVGEAFKKATNCESTTFAVVLHNGK